MISLIIPLLFSYNSTPLQPDMVYQNRYSFTSRYSLPSIVCLDSDDNMPIRIDNYISFEGIIRFNNPSDYFIDINVVRTTHEFYYSYYDDVANLYYYSLTDGANITYDDLPLMVSSNDNSFFNNYVFEIAGVRNKLGVDFSIYNTETETTIFNERYNQVDNEVIASVMSDYLYIQVDGALLREQAEEFIFYITSGSSEYERGYNEGSRDGYEDGYSDGWNDGADTDENVTSIFGGILNIGMLPVNFFLAIFNYEILGINLTAVVSAILSICVAIIVIRFIKGGN